MEKMTTRSLIPKQKNLLLEFIKKNEELQSGRFTNSFTHKKAQQLWQEIAEILNGVPGGAVKDWKQWRRVWADQKKIVKHKASDHKKSVKKTGGGEPPKDLNMTAVDEEILSLISPNVISGMDVLETDIDFNFDEITAPESNHGSGMNFDGSVANEVILVEGLPDIEIDKENEHNYCLENIENITESTPKTPRKRLSATAKHETALKLNQKLVNVIETKKNIMEEYYQEKIKYMRQKIEILNRNEKLLTEILRTLNNINNKFE